MYVLAVFLMLHEEWLHVSHFVLLEQNFKHGISILTAADYFSLGNVNNAFTTVAFHVAQYPEYRRHIIDHLYKTKLYHWDISIRTLSSKSLYGMTTLDPDEMRKTVLPYLVEHSVNENLFVRHGAVIGLAEVVLALGRFSNDEKSVLGESDDQALDSVVDLVDRIEKARLYRGRGGEIMRSAVCRLIECISQARLPLTVKQQVRITGIKRLRLCHDITTMPTSFTFMRHRFDFLIQLMHV